MHESTGRATDIERELVRIWSGVLGLPVAKIGAQDHFFALGGDSLLLTRVMSAVNATFFADRPDEGLAISTLLTHGTVRALAAHIASELMAREPPVPAAVDSHGDSIAIIGMSCRFPGAADTGTFWRNLREGVESITPLAEGDRVDAGTGDAGTGGSRFVGAAAFVAGVQLFDAEYFGVTAREAALLSPEHRLLIECSEEALQDAGYGARAGGENVGVFVGTGLSSYLLRQVADGRSQFDSTDGMALLAANTCAASRVCYLLDLTGPGVTMDTACSSSLVAVHAACRALLGGDCEMALAGGATVRRFGPEGYHAEEGGIFSPDGHCRPFDQGAQGTVSASGAGMVLLKRLSSALADGDFIHAVIRGTAVNNDGGSRAGYTAPSAAGQAKAILRALAVAKVPASQIQYLETHGTGTPLGDMIEIAALKEVFAPAGAPSSGCTLGTLKSNVGHLEAAAGIAGLIKVALALQHREMPPAIHFRQPAQSLGFDRTGLRLNRHLMSWDRTSEPRRAGLSSFGIGGTNAHAILEEPPRPPIGSSHRPAQLLVVSARSETALRESCRRLAQHLATDKQPTLADVAYTLQTGRVAHPLRTFVVASNRDEAIRDLELHSQAPQRATAVARPAVVYMFPGQGSQYPGMLNGLYESEPEFRAHLDRCSQLLEPWMGRNLRDVLSAPAGALTLTEWCQPALFAVEYSLARLWQSWGVTPSLLIGHSLGEYVAACLAGVFTLEDALRIVAARGRIVQGTQPGRMLAVPLSATETTDLLQPGCSIACINGPANCVVSGPFDAIETFQAVLVRSGLPYRELLTSHAFHSATLEGVLEEFASVFRGVRFGEARIPFVSNLTGTVVEGAMASSPAYWTSHLRQTVNFAAGLQCALDGEAKILLEVGPGNVLGGFVRAMPGSSRHTVIASARRESDETSDAGTLMRAAGELWQRSVDIDWRAFNKNNKTRRVSLPVYPFERQRHWIEGNRGAQASARDESRRAPLTDWFYVPVWRERPRLSRALPTCCVLIGGGNTQLERALAAELDSLGIRVVRVPMQEEAVARVLASVEEQGLGVTSIVYCAETAEPTEGVCQLIDLCKALAGERRRSVTLTLLTRSAYALTAEEVPEPAAAVLAAVAGVISGEFPEISCRAIDFVRATDSDLAPAWLQPLVDEIVAPCEDTAVVLRGGTRWVREFERLPLSSVDGVPMLRARGIYLVTGGLGGIGWSIAGFLARTLQARLILVSRRAFPDRDVRALENTGAEVMLMSADVSRPGDMEHVVARVRTRFGELHGVIHAAGIAGGGAVYGKSHDTALRVMAPKVAGTRLLYEACGSLQPDFFVCCSSLASVVAPAGQYDYCAANAYQDAFCRAMDGRTRTRFISVNWDAWRDVGMAVETVVPSHMKEQRARELIGGISSEEGVEVFKRILANPRPQWIINARGLLGAPGLNGTNRARREPLAEAAGLAKPGAENSVQGQVARIWMDLLGVGAASDDDDFFSLGGDSLLAMQLRARLEDHFSRSVSLAALVREPTLAAMTRLFNDSAPTGSVPAN